MKTLKKAIKEAIKKANEIHGFVIDNRTLCILFVKVESNYSDEYITKAEIRYKLSADEKAEIFAQILGKTFNLNRNCDPSEALEVECTERII